MIDSLKFGTPQSEYIRQAAIRAKVDKEFMEEIRVTRPTLHTKIKKYLSKQQ